MRQSNAQCRVCIFGLRQENWRQHILFSIAHGVRVSLVLDVATANRSFGNFTRVLVNIDLKQELCDHILVERDCFVFFVDLVYKKLSAFCDSCKVVGHSFLECQLLKKPTLESEKDTHYVPKQKGIVIGNSEKQKDFVTDNSKKAGPSHVNMNVMVANSVEVVHEKALEEVLDNYGCTDAGGRVIEMVQAIKDDSL